MKTYTTKIRKPRLVIQYDNYASSPRSDTNLGYFITCEKRYNSPDESEWFTGLIQNAGDESANQAEHIEKIKAEINNHSDGEKVLYIAPVYRHEHGNVSYERGTSNGFDNSNCGFYIITNKTFRVYDSYASADTKLDTKQAEAIIDAELEIYTQYANGEVYLWKLYDEKGEVIESGSNCYDLDGIKECLPEEWQDEEMSNYVADNY